MAIHFMKMFLKTFYYGKCRTSKRRQTIRQPHTPYPAPTHAHQPVYASRPPSASSTTIYYFEGNPTCIIFLPINISALISKTGSLNLGAVDIVNQVSLCCEELVLCIAGCFATFLRSLYQRPVRTATTTTTTTTATLPPPRCDNPERLQTLPNVSQGQKPKPRTAKT